MKPKIVKKQRSVVSRKLEVVQANTTQSVLPQGDYIEGVGRRKVATARVRIYPKVKGEFYVNGQLAKEYFSGVKNAPTLINQPLAVVDMLGSFAIVAQVSGSGSKAQLSAVGHGLARALVKYNSELRPLLKQANLLSRDDRMKETRKIGRGGKARRRRQSPKR